MFSSSCCSLLFEQIINDRCASVSIKLVLRFVGPNESQRNYSPVKVGFLKTKVKNPSSPFSTKTSGVVMGSQLNVALANIFVEYHESKLFESTNKPFLYHRYVDNTFAIFESEKE